jgi:hypothetical protein
MRRQRAADGFDVMELAVIPVLRNVATCAVAVLALLVRGGCLFLPATHYYTGRKKMASLKRTLGAGIF